MNKWSISSANVTVHLLKSSDATLLKAARISSKFVSAQTRKPKRWRTLIMKVSGGVTAAHT